MANSSTQKIRGKKTGTRRGEVQIHRQPSLPFGDLLRAQAERSSGPLSSVASRSQQSPSEQVQPERIEPEVLRAATEEALVAPGTRVNLQREQAQDGNTTGKSPADTSFLNDQAAPNSPLATTEPARALVASIPARIARPARRRIALDTTTWTADQATAQQDTAEQASAQRAKATQPSNQALAVESLPAPRPQTPRVIETLGTAFVVSMFLAAALLI